MTPEFSPAMLRFFLHARAAHATFGLAGGKRYDALRRFKAGLRKAAGVTATEFDMAWMGRLPTPRPRARLWGALGHVTADAGVRLTHGGQEHG